MAIRRGGKTWTNYHSRHLWLWREWGFSLTYDWYDGPFWQLWLGPLVFYWSLEGLPYIFQDEVTHD